jgi:hypothetical protein
MEKLITTKQYMGNPSELHHAYFLQFATHRTESYVLSSLKVDDIKKAIECGDVHLNEIKIPYNNMGYGGGWWWDNAPINLSLLKEAGGSNSPSTRTCVAKAVAKELAKQ